MIKLWRRWNRIYVGWLWQIDGWLTRWWHRNSVRIEGDCQPCGECCKRLVLTQGGQPVQTQNVFQQMILDDPFTYDRFLAVDRNSDGDLLFRCTKLGEDNLCSVYEDRPILCRRYPEPRMFLLGARLPEPCTYRVLVQIKDVT